MYRPLLSGLALLCAAGCTTMQVAAAKPAPVPGKMQEIQSPGAHRDAAVAYRSDTVQVALAPKGDAAKGDQVEYMVHMTAGDALTYSWDAPGASKLWHEFHGHTAQAVTFYKKADGATHKGVLTAPFDGSHGWYFENRSDKPVVIHVQLGGFYTLVKKQSD